MSGNELTTSDFTQENEPYSLFGTWLKEAEASEPNDPNARALATVDADGMPNVRMVLLKSFDSDGFVFFTNLGSPKAENLRTNPRAELCFHWTVLERQVRVAGEVEPVTTEEADAYFATRPRLSQLGAWASRQSKPMLDRHDLVKAVARAAVRYPMGTVPRPMFWSGYRVVPTRIEFWQQRPFRHHDRQRFTREREGWSHEWLFP